MTTENKSQEEVVVPEINEGEGESIVEVEMVSVPKKDYDNLNQTLGSLKRENKDLKKPKEELKETPSSNAKTDDKLLERVEKMALRQAGITHSDDIELAQKTAKKWGVDLEEVLADEDFKVKLERQQTGRDNLAATSKVKGGAGTTATKNTPEYWLAKGTPPTPADIPDRKVRAKIAAAFLKNSGSNNKQFYND